MRAYTIGAQEVLAKAVKISLVPMVKISFSVPYPLYETAKHIVLELDSGILAEEFTDKVTLCIRMEKKFTDLLKEKFNELGNGKIQLQIEELDLLSGQKL